MSTAELVSDLELLAQRQTDRPLDFAQKLPHQQAVWDVLIAGKDPTTGAALEHRPTELVLVGANRCGKTECGGMVIDGHALGRSRFKKGGRLWTGSESLSVSAQTLEVALAKYLGPTQAQWKGNVSELTESKFRTRQGFQGRCRSYEQQREKWQGAKLQAVWLDEQPPDAIVSEAKARLIDEGGYLLHTFTPLKGTTGDLYKRAHVPWQDYLERHPGATCGEVRPGLWVVTAGMRDNTYLTPEFVDGYERDLLELGHVLEARVRVHGEWIDMSGDKLLPVEQWLTYSEEPKGGYVAKRAHIDPAAKAKTSNCRTAVSVVGRSQKGKLDVVACEGGHWEAHEKVDRVCAVLIAHDCPLTTVQNTTGDVHFGDSVNRELIRRGHRACVQPESGKTQDKVTRAQSFAPLMASGQSRYRPEMVELKRQAGLLSAEYLKRGGLCDDIDAVMAATDAAAAGGVHVGGLAQDGFYSSPQGTLDEDAPVADEDFDWRCGADWDYD